MIDMYVFLGGDYTIYSKNVVAVFDFENITTRDQGRSFLARCEKEGNLFYAYEEGTLPKSIVVTSDLETNERRVYLSAYNSSKILAEAKRSIKNES